jgi:CheY-like chemotaxis protein
MSSRGTVLVVDDDENDLLLLGQAFKEAGIANPMRKLRNGFEVIDYLKGKGPYANRGKNPLPCLMLLDLKMPGCDGFKVLAWLHTQKGLPHFPIIVFTASNQERDIQKAMGLGATAYSVKPSSFNYLVTMAKELRSRYLERHDKPHPAIREV